MPNQRYTPDLLASINREVAQLRQPLQQALARHSPPKVHNRAVEVVVCLQDHLRHARTIQPAEEIVAALDARIERIERLEQVRDWIEEDQQFSALVDAVIGKQVQAAMRRRGGSESST